MPVSPSRYDVFTTRYEVFARMVRGVERGNPRSLHRMRMASRRLRELLPILGLDADATRKLARRLRRVTDRLGSGRAADVLIALLGALREDGRRRGGVPGPARAVADDPDPVGRRLASKLPTAELRRLAHRLAEVADTLRPHSPAPKGRPDPAWRWAVDARVANRAEQLADA